MSTTTIQSAPLSVSSTVENSSIVENSSTHNYIRRVQSPIGRIEIRSNGTAVTALSIERSATLPADDLPENADALLELAAVQLAEYFRGERTSFELPIAPIGSSFQQAVWRELAAVPYGTATSYGELGRATGRAAAGRAVGGAVGANPIPIIVPCHRVLASDMRITGYSGGEGIPTKEWLLALEGISHR
ncbi:MAG: methylated-DNA--[protein]-cysteine S-methyltransferase [Salinibacterium sp.]|nr:methylated-DNA--[protein]-cysteine S-methyltransferase [Salinibacterium sp.]